MVVPDTGELFELITGVVLALTATLVFELVVRWQAAPASKKVEMKQTNSNFFELTLLIKVSAGIELLAHLFMGADWREAAG